MEINELLISELKFAEYNPRVITKDEFEGLKKSLLTFGFVDPIIVNKDLTIIGGHQRTRAWQSLGNEYVPAVLLDLDKRQEKKLNVVLNSQAISGKYDEVKLSEILEELKLDEDYEALRLNELEVLDLSGGNAVDDDYELPPEAKYKIELGEVFKLGNHVLMCGDSTNLDDVEKLMGENRADMVFTDPPYNVDYEGKTKQKLKIKNDKAGDEEFYNFLLDAFMNMAAVTKAGGAIYVCHADSEGLNFRKAFMDAGYLLKQCIIWNKNVFVMGRQDYQWKHEPILYGWKDGASHTFYADRTQSTVWDIDRPSRSKEHPTMKPVELIERALLNSSKEEDVILDLFGGSGSTLVTCDQINRRCYTMELDPYYVSVIIERWEKLTGKSHEKLQKEESTQ